jgi:hypothetical protein
MDEQEHKMACLARWILTHYKTRAERRSAVAGFRERNGEVFAAEIETLIHEEIRKRKTHGNTADKIHENNQQRA